jgi:hypothetical protein
MSQNTLTDINGNDGEGIFIAYKGTRAKEVRWLQLLSVFVRPLVETGEGPNRVYTLKKGMSTFEMPVPLVQKDWGGTNMKVSTPDEHHLHLDTGAGKAIWYTDTTEPKTGLGNSMNDISWISDRPTIVENWAKNQKQLINQKATCPGKIVAFLVKMDFDDFAVLDTPPTRYAFAHVGWSAYASTEFLNNGLPLKVLNESNNGWSTITADTKLHVATIPEVGPIGPNTLNKVLGPGKNGSGSSGGQLFGPTLWNINWDNVK